MLHGMRSRSHEHNMTIQHPREIEVSLNGLRRRVAVKSNWTLLRLIRDSLGCKSVKEVCGIGECGACTVIKDGRAVSSCIELAILCQGATILTAEGLTNGEDLHPLQDSFVKEGGFQCGFCTPGMILMAKALLDENPNPTLDEIKEYMSGNLCRCTGYWQIIESIQNAVHQKNSKRIHYLQQRNSKI